LQYYKVVIQIIDSVCGLIYTAGANVTHRLSPRGHMNTSRVYAPIYTVNTMYN